MSGVRIHEEISAHGFSSSYEIVKKYVSKLKRKENIFVRIHTPVGHEAQVDFGYVGKTLKTWVINMRLNYSRLDYYEKIYEQRVGTFINCHINAFEYFRAIPEVVRIDNLKAAILEERMYKDFARCYVFRPVPCCVYHPNKGKVESEVKYVKISTSHGRDLYTISL